MSENGFVKLIRSTSTDFLQEKHPNAFLLLSLIARRARWNEECLHDLNLGECYIGDFRKAGIKTRKQYRTALEYLKNQGIIQIIETCRKRACPLPDQNLSTKRATKGTIVSLLNTKFYDINKKSKGHQKGHLRATLGPRTKKERKKEEVDYLTSPTNLTNPPLPQEAREDEDEEEELKFFICEDVEKWTKGRIPRTEMLDILEEFSLDEIQKSWNIVKAKHPEGIPRKINSPADYLRNITRKSVNYESKKNKRIKK